MAKLGIRNFQDLIGRTDLLKVREDLGVKAKMLDLKLLLKNALELRPNTNIVAGSLTQNFELEKRTDNDLIQKCQGVINGTEDEITIDTVVHNEMRAFTSTLSFEIAS